MHEVVVLIPLVDLAQMLLKDQFNPNAKFQANLTNDSLTFVQFDRKENEMEPEPPKAVDPEAVT